MKQLKELFLKSMFRLLFIIFLISPLTVLSQRWDLNKQWELLGPDSIPHMTKQRVDAGTGPIEFIRINKQQEGLFLAGSLTGGLFYSENGGDQWINAGSDDWFYSGCGWADFHPTDIRTWFAYSNKDDSNGKPGIIGREGGIMRTTTAGFKWERIADHRTFGNQYVKVYGTRFHPEKPNMMFVMTTAGLFYTDDCTAAFVKWSKVTAIDGWIYDLDFLNGKMYVSNFLHGKWGVSVFDQNDLTKSEKVGPVHDDLAKKRTITMEPRDNMMLFLFDKKTGADVLAEYDPEKDSLVELLTNQRVNFGHGHSFAVNPHTNAEVMLGYSTSVRKYAYPAMKNINMNREHHVDIECIQYDPWKEDRIYLCTHGGVYISDDRGKSWRSRSVGLGVAEINGMDVSMTDPEQIVVGCNHDGSSVRADWDHNGKYYWRIVNGGDALQALIHPDNPAIVYTSNQYAGGGSYYSDDTAKTNVNLHGLNKLKTAGWENMIMLHPKNPDLLYFNFMHNKGESKGNTDIARTLGPEKKMNAEVISDFKRTHGLNTFKVYGMYTSEFYPDQLFAYVLHYDVNEENKKITRHRLFRCYDATDTAAKVMDSWIEMEIPGSRWIADMEVDPLNDHVIYLSYTSGKAAPETMFGDKGIVYTMKYKKGTGRMRREIDVTRNIPNTVAGRFNLIVVPIDKRRVIIGTRTGLWLGDTKVIRGRGRWRKIGHGLPHTKVMKIHYHPEKEILTVGYNGRSVWRYYLGTE